jgi:hypothetical protein
MAKAGFQGRGFYTSRLLFGPGTTDIDVQANSAIYNVTDYSSLCSGPEDLYCRNLNVSAQLVPAAFQTGTLYSCFRIFCSGTLTLNSGSIIRADGQFPSGDVGAGDLTGGSGYVKHSSSDTWSYGTLGGSGGGGNGSATSDGTDGGPQTTVDTFAYLGGSGGNGIDNGAHTPGDGGICAFRSTSNSLFQPSVYQDAIIWGNQTSSQSLIFPSKICGGGGGGGSSDTGLASGGGGAGGGVVYIAADTIVFNNGNITAMGQSSAYGAGGGGGVVILVTNRIVWQTHASGINVTGGVGLNGAGGRPVDCDGADGRILLFSDELITSFTGTMDWAKYEAARKLYQQS